MFEKCSCCLEKLDILNTEIYLHIMSIDCQYYDEYILPTKDKQNLYKIRTSYCSSVILHFCL